MDATFALDPQLDRVSPQLIATPMRRSGDGEVASGSVGRCACVSTRGRADPRARVNTCDYAGSGSSTCGCVNIDAPTRPRARASTCDPRRHRRPRLHEHLRLRRHPR